MDRAQFIVGSAAWTASLVLPRSSGILRALGGAPSGGPSSAPARVPGRDLGRQSGKFGVAWSSESLAPAVREDCYGMLDEIGATWSRIGAVWNHIDAAVTAGQVTPGNYPGRDWSGFDSALDAALAHHKTVIVSVSTFAAWANGGRDRCFVPDPSCVPDEATALGYWGDFCGCVVEHCEARWPGRIGYYEIWNEPDCPRFWTNGATSWDGTPARGAYPGAYLKLLRQAYLSIKAANASAKIIGMVNSRTFVGFLREYYAQAAIQFPAEHGQMNDYFDVLGCHPYCDDRAPDDNDPAFIWNSGTLNRNFLGLVDLYQELVAHGDGDKGIICTEFGWHTASSPGWPEDPYVVSEAQQADYLVRAFEMARHWPWLKALMTFGFRNEPFDEEPWSLIRADFSHKPAYEAFAYASRRGT
jgi:hypothetical protein